MSRTPRARSHTSTPVQGEGACTWRAWRVGVQVVCERPLIGSTSACACVQTGRGGGAVARTSLPAPLHHRSERLERLVSATVLPPSTLCSTIRYTVCVHYKPITENSNCTLLLRYFTVCTRYSYPWVRGALSTESRISVKRRSIQDFPGLGPLWYAREPPPPRARPRPAGRRREGRRGQPEHHDDAAGRAADAFAGPTAG